ncbi:unnamed protein product, partial [marine sediment metagenome]
KISGAASRVNILVRDAGVKSLSLLWENSTS